MSQPSTPSKSQPAGAGGAGGSVVARDLRLHAGPQLVLGGVSVTVAPGDRLAVVGPNGVGKTTLLRVLTGELAAESGSVVRHPGTATVGLLPQERDARPGETLHGYLSRRTGVSDAERALDEAAGALAEHEGAKGTAERYDRALEAFLALGAADFEARAPGVLTQVGLDPERLGDPVTGLSGGQLARLALASVLLARFDVLLLDEPTNDLDFAGLDLLEGFLAAREGGLAVVSHDRMFLERLASGVLELDEFSHAGTTYGGGYASYVEERERARTLQQQAFEAYVDKKNALQEQARKQREWARSGVRGEKRGFARGQADNDKAQRDFRINKTERGMARAASAERAAERLEVVEEPRTPWELRLTLAARSRSGDQVAGLSDVVVRRGGFTLGPVNLDLRYADRLVVQGPNGSGKSTLIATLLGRLEPDRGTRWLGHGVVIGEIDQVRRGIDPRIPLLQGFRELSRIADEPEARSLLAKFGLEADDVVRLTGSLSPGERTRADLALLVARQANLLVLDEPTNHLDLPAVEQLEQALGSYDGTLVLATHDRRLLEAVPATHVALVEDGQVEVTAATSGP